MVDREGVMDVELRRALRRWGKRWGVAGLDERVSVSFSSRLRRSLGRSVPARGRVSLHVSLRYGPRARLAEVLCHEVAHIAVYELHGRSPRPHGAEWARLVTAAGFRPTVRARGVTTARPHLTDGRTRQCYEHVCPVCQTTRFARRPVRRWHCAQCVAAGLDGEMVITALASVSARGCR